MGLLMTTPPSFFRISSKALRQFTTTMGSWSRSKLYSSFTNAPSAKKQRSLYQILLTRCHSIAVCKHLSGAKGTARTGRSAQQNWQLCSNTSPRHNFSLKARRCEDGARPTRDGGKAGCCARPCKSRYARGTLAWDLLSPLTVLLFLPPSLSLSAAAGHRTAPAPGRPPPPAQRALPRGGRPCGARRGAAPLPTSESPCSCSILAQPSTAALRT